MAATPIHISTSSTGYNIAYIQGVTSQLSTLHVFMAKARIAPQTLLVARWLDPLCSCEIFSVQRPYTEQNLFLIKLISS